MTCPKRNRQFLQISPQITTTAWAIAFVLAVTLLAAHPVAAQPTYTKIHDFSGADGAYPYSGLAIDRAGNLYGTTFVGGSGPCTSLAGYKGCGTVFKLTHKGSGWLLNPLYTFLGGNDGALPAGLGVILAADGSLYGNTQGGGGGACVNYGVPGCGTVFNLRPQPTACKSALCPWTETVLYSFTGGSDGAFPTNLIFDQAGNLYGLASGDDNSNPTNLGTAFELTPSGGSWTHSVLYTFNAPGDGCYPTGTMVFAGGNLYGASGVSGICGIAGTFWQLTPSESGWTEKILYSFPQDLSQGSNFFAGLTSDASGNYYGAAAYGGPASGGVAFELTNSGGNWAPSRLYGFAGMLSEPGCGPWGNFTMDQSGNLYGTTVCDGAYHRGSVFKLTPSDGTWTYTSLYDFKGGTDGAYPYTNIVFDSSGNLYGTTYSGGANGYGVVFQITP